MENQPDVVALHMKVTVLPGVPFPSFKRKKDSPAWNHQAGAAAGSITFDCVQWSSSPPAAVWSKRRATRLPLHASIGLLSRMTTSPDECIASIDRESHIVCSQLPASSVPAQGRHQSRKTTRLVTSEAGSSALREPPLKTQLSYLIDSET